MSVSKIHDLVRDGAITPEQGASLLLLRIELQWARMPWWQKAATILVDAITGRNAR